MIARWLPLSALTLGVVGARNAVAITGSTEAAASLSPLGCPLRETTGLPCPTCGLGRSVVASADLDLAGALGHHPFGPLLLAGAFALAVAVALGRGPRIVAGAKAWLARPTGRSALWLLVGAYVATGLAWNYL